MKKLARELERRNESLQGEYSELFTSTKSNLMEEKHSNYFKPASIQNIPPPIGSEQKELSKIKVVLDKMPIACIIHDTEFRIIYWNGVAEEIFGYTFEEVKQKLLFEIITPEYLKPYYGDLMTALKNGNMAFDSQEENRTKDGESIICEWSNTPFYDEYGTFIGVMCMGQDITERVQNESLLNGQKNILEMIASGRSFSEILDTLIKFMEKESGRALGSILLLDAEGKTLHTAAGPSLPDEYNQMVNGLEVAPYNGSCPMAILEKKMFIAKDTTKNEHWAKYKDVAIRFGLMACTSIPIFGTNQQILGTFAFYYRIPCSPSPYELKMIETSSALAGIAIERDRTERALKESEELYRLITENIHDLIGVYDMEGNFIYCSPSVYTILGFTQEDLIGNNVLNYIYPDDIPLYREAINKVSAGGLVNLIYRTMHKDGSWHWIEGSGTIIEKQDKKYIVGVGRDITGRKLIEENQKHLTEDLMEQNKYLQQFGYITSHNLRAPISNILGLVELLNLNPKEDDRKLFLDNLKKAAVNLDTIIKDLNSIISIKKGSGENREELSLDDLMYIINANLKNQIEYAQAEISMDFKEAPAIYSISSYVQSILSNLVENAIKYRSPKRPLVIKIGSHKEEDFICLSVCDNGLGIDLEKQGNKVFGLYKRFHSHVEGKGLGLHIVKTQIESLGGKITVQSQSDKGTCFKVYFPKRNS